MKRSFRILSLLTSFVFLLVLGQNCSQVINNKAASAHESGNGDSYTGLTGQFLYFAAVNPCQQLATDGTPFPNREIFYQQGQYALVRDNCQDIAPVVLASSDIAYNANNNTVTYQGQSFGLTVDFTKYNLIAPVCPAGRTVTNSKPTNIFQDPLNLAATSWVSVHPQIPAVLDGSISALPRYLVEVTSTNPADWYDWMRVGQAPSLKPNTMYAITFLLQAGSRTTALLTYNEGQATNTSYTGVYVDLQNGTATVDGSQNLQNPTLSMRPYGSGYLITMFVTSSATVVTSDTGVAPTRELANLTVQPGDSIYATAASFYEVGTYCSP